MEQSKRPSKITQKSTRSTKQTRLSKSVPVSVTESTKSRKSARKTRKEEPVVSTESTKSRKSTRKSRKEEKSDVKVSEVRMPIPNQTTASTPINGPRTDPTEQMQSVKRRHSKPSDKEENMTTSIKRSFKRLRKKSSDKFTQVIELVNRPYREKAMKKMLKRVEVRKNMTEDDAASRLKEGDDTFPRGKPRSKMLAPDETPVEVPSKSPANLVEDKTQKSTPKSGVKAYRNDVPPGQTTILVNGRPFWQQTRKGQHKELLDADEITDDTLPMNAEVLVEVDKGNVKLKDLPKTKVKLNPYACVRFMKSRDAEFFHDDLIMSNSIRTMLNLADDPEDMELKSRKEMSPENDQRDPNDQRKLVIEEPVVMYVYDLNDQTYGGIVEEI